MAKRYTHDHVICKCGCIVKQNYITKHLQTNKHERWMNGESSWMNGESRELLEPVKWEK
jgi:hypothetical protein